MKVIIQGFQSARDPVVLELEGLTVLTGESNRGKSAIVRAIRAPLENRSGTDFISVGCDEVRVRLEDREHVIEWIKNRSGSASYIIDGQEYHKLGRGCIPVEISSLGIQEIRTASGKKVWPQIQGQHDSVFLLSESAATAAELLGASSVGAQVARAIRLAGVEGQRARVTVGVLERQVGVLERQVGVGRDWGERLRVAGEQVQQAAGRCRQVQARREQVAGLVARYRRVWRYAKGVQGGARQVVPVAPRATAIRWGQLRGLCERYRRVQALCTVAGQRQIELPAPPDWTVQVTSIDRYRKLISLYNQLSLECHDVQKSLDYFHIQQTNLEQEHKDIINKLQGVTSCPLCTAPLRDGVYQGP